MGDVELCDSELPSFFETVAADSLVSSLRSALAFSVSVFAARNPRLNPILEHEDEAFACLMLLLEWQSLASNDASVAESLYGLRRAGAASGAAVGLSRLQRLGSVVALVVLPYLRAKAARAYAARTGGTAAQLGLLPSTRPSTDAVPSRAERAFLTLYPLCSTAVDLLSWTCGVAFVLGKSRTHSPSLRALRLALVRCQPGDADALGARGAKARAALLRGVPAGRALLQLFFAAADAARPTLLAAVLAFKLAEWWFSADTQKAMAPDTKLPVPPPPPPLPLAFGGVPLPLNKRLCPLCNKTRKNAALCAPSGLAFCYPCIFGALQATGRCPVTGVPCSEAELWRLF